MKKTILIYLLILSSLSFVSAQCYPDRHNTTWFDSWISCDQANSPNSSRGSSHWIMYDLGEDYVISRLHFWNLNVPGRLQDGVKRLAIDISDDGTDWMEVGEYSIDSAEASSIYQGVDIPDFGPVTGRYLLLTVLESWGGNCAGFSELRIQVEPNIVSSTSTESELNCKAKDNAIRLSWAPYSKGETVKVEWSPDGMKWQNTAFRSPIESADGSFYWDDRQTEQGYYRLQRIQSGAVFYSKVHYCSRSALSASVWPNPVKERCQLRITSTSKAPILYSIRNVLGQTVYERKAHIEGPLTYIDLNVDNLPTGSYIIDIKQKNQTASTPFVKF